MRSCVLGFSKNARTQGTSPLPSPLPGGDREEEGPGENDQRVCGEGATQCGGVGDRSQEHGTDDEAKIARRAVETHGEAPHLAGGDVGLGVECLQRAVQIATWLGVRKRALVALAHALRKSGDAQALAQVWRCYAAEFPDENLGYVELAKVYEHRRRNYGAALDAARAAPEVSEALTRRIARLRARLALAPSAASLSSQEGSIAP